MYQATIFDLDGTLLDTLEDLADSMNAALISMGFPSHPIESYRFFVGEGIEMLARRTLPQTERSDAKIAQAVAAMEREYDQRWEAKTQPYAGVPQLLDGLTQRKMPKAILSNKPDPFTRISVEKLLASWHFNPVRGARPDIPRKPDPAGALAIAAELELNPAQCLYLGDTNTDMQTALAAGMFAVGATWGFRPAAELKASGAQALVDHPLELLELL